MDALVGGYKGSKMRPTILASYNFEKNTHIGETDDLTWVSGLGHLSVVKVEYLIMHGI